MLRLSPRHREDQRFIGRSVAIGLAASRMGWSWESTAILANRPNTHRLPTRPSREVYTSQAGLPDSTSTNQPVTHIDMTLAEMRSGPHADSALEHSGQILWAIFASE